MLAILAAMILAATANADLPGGGDDKGTPAKGQVGFWPILINGRAVTGPNSLAQTRDGRLMVPISTIARILGDRVILDVDKQQISVIRQTGTAASFNLRLGQITENGSVVLTITSTLQLSPFTPDTDAVMLPTEVAAALLDAAIRLDSKRNAVLVTRGIHGVVTQQKQKRAPAEIYTANYEYDLTGYNTSASSSLNLNAIGRIGDGRFSFRSISSGNSFAALSRANVNFDLERPNGQHFMAGDLGSGTSLSLMSANIRGVLVTLPAGGYSFTAFGGRSSSGTSARGLVGDPASAALASGNPQFDTTVAGGYVTKAFAPFTISAGGMMFEGRTRNGSFASTSLTYVSGRLQAQADVGVGSFRGTTTEGRTVNGWAPAADISASFKARSNLSFFGRYIHIGANFLSPQRGFREPIDSAAGGLSYSPVRWLNASVNVSRARRLGAATGTDSFVSTSISLSPGIGKPQFYFSHTESSSLAIRRGEFTVFNFSQALHRARIYANTTRVKNIGPASINVQFGGSYIVNDRNTFEVSQGIASHHTYNGLGEWRSERWLNGRLGFSGGFGYNSSPNSGVSTFEKASASLSLPKETSLQASYIRTVTGPTFLMQLKGNLFRRANADSYLYAHESEIDNYAKVSGRVFQDVDGDGKYQPGTDKPQRDATVRIDGSRYVVTDANGLFSFDAVEAGQHKVYVDLLTVRADMTLVDGGSRDLVLEAGTHTQLDFRLARSGRITGRVFIDANENGRFDEEEQPLSEVRVVTSSGRDTLTDNDGVFSIADLVPGEHVVLIDEKTLPEKLLPASKPLAVKVFEARETGGVWLAVVPLKAEVKQFSHPQK
ncbi:MAG: stalk domain-containing protein [Pyrinomonadaceae bacterium]